MNSLQEWQRGDDMVIVWAVLIASVIGLTIGALAHEMGWWGGLVWWPLIGLLMFPLVYLLNRDKTSGRVRHVLYSLETTNVLVRNVLDKKNLPYKVRGRYSYELVENGGLQIQITENNYKGFITTVILLTPLNKRHLLFSP
jgi:hypothetical protein